MVMDDDTHPTMPSTGDGLSAATIAVVSVGGIILFLAMLLLISTISNREEGTLAGKDLQSYLDAQIVEAVDSDLAENQYWEEKA